MRFFEIFPLYELSEEFSGSYLSLPNNNSGGHMPRGASPKREREYKELKSKFKQEGRYAGHEEEVASRIVNKQRAAKGETKSGKKR